MSDSIFNRPRRQEPRMPDERSRDFRDHTPDQGTAERRDPGAEAMSELARMIAGTDPIPDAGHKSGGRLADVSRNTISPARSSLDRGARREPDFGSEDFLQLPDRGDYAVAPQHAMTDEDRYHGDEQRYSGYGRQDEEYAGEYHDDQYGQDGDHEYGDEHDDSGHREPGVKRRSTAKMAFAILVLAVFGSAAAFGYRTIFKAAPSGPTPIIRADNSPTKVAPAATEASARPANGLFGDRSGEQLVRRDEEPVDVGVKFGGVDSGVAGSGPPETVPPTAAPLASPTPAVSTTSGDPKRVRTVRIGADQGPAPSDRTPSRAVPPPQSQPAVPPPQRQAAAAPPPQRQAAAVPPPPYIPPAVEEGRVKGAAPVAATPSEAPAARAVEGGGFVVQLSAQRSEAEAQTAFHALQTKYSMLGGHEPLIRRKDLGDRGIFFAAQVGPFGAKSDADQLCESLKAAGGACFVQKN